MIRYQFSLFALKMYLFLSIVFPLHNKSCRSKPTINSKVQKKIFDRQFPTPEEGTSKCWTWQNTQSRRSNCWTVKATGCQKSGDWRFGEAVTQERRDCTQAKTKGLFWSPLCFLVYVMVPGGHNCMCTTVVVLVNYA